MADVVILSVSEISTEFKTRFLNLWILRFLAKAQYDKQNKFCGVLGGLILGIFVFDEQK